MTATRAIGVCAIFVFLPTWVRAQPGPTQVPATLEMRRLAVCPVHPHALTTSVCRPALSDRATDKRSPVKVVRDRRMDRPDDDASAEPASGDRDADDRDADDRDADDRDADDRDADDRDADDRDADDRDADSARTPGTAGPLQRPKDTLPRRAGYREPFRRLARTARAVFGKRALSEKVIFRFNIGFGLDGGESKGAAARLRNGQPLTDYADLRIYSFGNVVLGSRGLVSPSLSTYLASQFRIDQEPEQASTALPSAYDAIISEQRVRDNWIRSAYATWQGIGDNRWLKPLFIRLGRQYRYGPAIAHFDGVTLGYDSKPLSVGAFYGAAVDATGLPLERWYRNSAMISGLDGRLDLYEFNKLPLVLSGDVLRFDAQTHMRGSLALRVSRDIALSANVRSRGVNVARTGLQLRARISNVTTVHLDVESRSIHDWMYDLFTVEARSGAADPDDPLHYFRLGKPLPRLYLGGRAGIVLLRNIDLLVHGRAAIRRRSADEPEDAPESPHASSYAQGGGAVEIRVRRSVALGMSLLVRRYWRSDVIVTNENDNRDRSERVAPIVIEQNTMGERSFVDFGSTLSYSQGARKFSARTEVYVRYYRMQSPYAHVLLLGEKRLQEISPDVRAGARFIVEGWAGDNLRLKAEYELTSELLVAPELSGLKSLRILAEGRF